MIRTYKGHTIEKISKGNIRNGYHLEYYTVDGKGFYLYLKDAKKAIDEEEI